MTSPVFIGIDPGLSGAVAVLSPAGRLVDVFDMPVVDKRVNATLLRGIIWPHAFFVYPDTRAVVEQVASRPGQGVASTFKFGVGYGVVLGVLGALEIPVTHVTPSTWKRAVGVTADKGSSRRKAIDLWPDRASMFARVKDDGRAESALIAWWAWREHNRKAAS